MFIYLGCLGLFFGLAAFAAVIFNDTYQGQTLGAEGPLDLKVFTEPNIKGEVNSHHLIDVPTIPASNNVFTAEYELPIEDIDANTVPDSNLLKDGFCYELTDIALSVDPWAFVNNLPNVNERGGRLGLAVDVFTVGVDGYKADRARLAWRCESFSSASPKRYEGPKDIVPTYLWPLSPFWEYLFDEFGCIVDIDNLDFEYDPVTLSEHFQTPILIYPDEGGVMVNSVWFRITFYRDLNNRVSKWIQTSDGVKVTFSGRYREIQD
jgi:hypothetical protein